MQRKAVSQFIVAPPADQRSEIMGAKEHFKAHLSENFPGYDFLVTTKAPFDDSDFQVIPMMGTVGADNDGAGSEMRDMPEQWFLDDIVQVCRRFDIANSRRRAS